MERNDSAGLTAVTDEQAPRARRRAGAISPANGGRKPSRPAPHRIQPALARESILAAWPAWAEKNLAGRAAKDNDIHMFLCAVRADHPEFFTFRSRVTPYETAFFWLFSKIA